MVLLWLEAFSKRDQNVYGWSFFFGALHSGHADRCCCLLCCLSTYSVYIWLCRACSALMMSLQLCHCCYLLSAAPRNVSSQSAPWSSFYTCMYPRLRCWPTACRCTAVHIVLLCPCPAQAVLLSEGNQFNNHDDDIIFDTIDDAAAVNLYANTYIELYCWSCTELVYGVHDDIGSGTYHTCRTQRQVQTGLVNKDRKLQQYVCIHQYLVPGMYVPGTYVHSSKGQGCG